MTKVIPITRPPKKIRSIRTWSRFSLRQAARAGYRPWLDYKGVGGLHSAQTLELVKWSHAISVNLGFKVELEELESKLVLEQERDNPSESKRVGLARRYAALYEALVFIG